MTHGTRFGALVLVAALWCRGTFGAASTEEKIQIFNIHVDEYATKAVVTWETNFRTDTTVKYGRTEQYQDLKTNPEQKSETIHSITLEGLAKDTTYHYQIVASDPRGVRPQTKSEDLQFRTSREDALGEGKESAGLVSLTKSYVDKLTRMTPDEREKLKSSLQKFTDPRAIRGPAVALLRRAPKDYPATSVTVPLPAPGKLPQPVASVAPAVRPSGLPEPERSGDAFEELRDNAFRISEHEPLSTFSIDVDTASYALMRRFLDEGTRPPKDAVRIEEMINTFSYAYPAPDEGETLTAHAEVASCPWKPEHRLLKVGLKGKEVSQEKRPATNLVFLIDVSGSMSGEDRLPLVIKSLELLIPTLRAQDRVSLVVYAGNSGLVLAPTSGDQHAVIRGALERLQAGGSTNGGQGLALAYKAAQDAFIKSGVNRVVLCTDGDWNVGMTGHDEIIAFAAARAKEGVFLSVLGFGMGNYKDQMVEQLADKGNGNYAYIDGIKEARKVLVEQAGGTLQTIAKDVKLQLEFNPKKIAGYRLIGYENRILAAQDFNDDKKDAGDLGAGHTVTALYELVPAGLRVPDEKNPAPAAVDPLRYQRTAPTAESSAELLTLKLRYKQPAEDKSRLLEFHVGDTATPFDRASADLRFASAVAEFGMLLRESPYKGSSSFDGVATIAESALGTDPFGHRHDFLAMVNKARKFIK